MEGSKEEYKFDMWKCPQCEYLIYDCQMNALPVNHGCIRCGRSLDEFIFCPGKPDVHPTEKNGG
jgi:hypothetical protein